MGKLLKLLLAEEKNGNDTDTTTFNLPPNKMMAVSTQKTMKKNMMDSKATEARMKKGCCICAPTSHPGSFRCRLHRAGEPWISSSPTVLGDNWGRSANSSNFRSINTQGSVVGGKPQLSRFGRAALAQREHQNDIVKKELLNSL